MDPEGIELGLHLSILACSDLAADSVLWLVFQVHFRPHADIMPESCAAGGKDRQNDLGWMT